ncbi:uncharacterized protein BXZ73DRAFT_107524 [Epithele typhae]|uniref:uncharacterized protein n=1 Tax=Epithele typhae TaxID=378194 RepID=UPI00200888F3|nr:uncharacterized protein BXZ73DRAFT_107524 [Epithele typhae]KAH9912239.1 hypothetical protein BXZ73DRAFT_107524 [Epithele typhae]
MQVPNAFGGLKLFWDRVTFSRLTKFYFIFSVLHCVIQVIFQAQAYVANADAASFINGLIVQGNATDSGFAVYDGDLRICETVPTTLDPSSCDIVWDGHTKGNVTNIVTNPDTYNAALMSSQASSSSSSVSSAARTPSTSANVVGSTSLFSSLVSSSTTSSSPPVSSSTPLSSSSVLSSTARAPASSNTIASKPVTITLTTSTVVATVRDKATVTVTSPAPSTTLSHAGQLDADSDSDDGDSDDDDESDDEDDVVIIHRRTPVLPSTLQRLSLKLNGSATVDLNGVGGYETVNISRKCLYSLNWPLDIVENTKREDIAFIAFQFWLLGMSLVALLNESIPHIVASLLTHILATAWGGFQIANTETFHRKFTTLTTQGACGVNLLPNYWRDRSNAEIPSTALNCFALLVSVFLSWKLMKTFGWQTFKRVGASRTINRVYNSVLVLSIVIQLSLFFIGASAALWLDQVSNGNIGRLTGDPMLFKGVMITVLILLVPWLSLGWISVRQEFRLRMMVFLSVAVLILAGWASMFIAPTFRWTYATWLFFSLMTTGALLLAVTTLVLGIFCRLNFGKGLKRYLNAEEELLDSPDETTYDSEKFAFPSNDSPIPTYSVSFGSGSEVPPPSQMRFATRGPRFYSSSSNGSNPFESPFETPPGSEHGGSPRGAGLVGLPSPPSLSRQTSRSSTRSASSTASKGTQNARRWVIE